MSAYLILGEYIASSTSQLFTFASFTALLCFTARKHAGFRFSSSMLLYMFCGAALGFFSFIHLLYLTIYWGKSEAELSYDSRCFWFTGLFQSIFLLSLPITVFFLCINRILTILYPLQFTDRLQLQATVGMAFILVLINSAVILHDYIPFFPSNSSKTTKCRAFGCMTVAAPIYLNIRYIIAASNVLAGIVLMILVRKNLKGATMNSQTNKILLITVFASLIFDFIPHFSDLIFIKVFDFQLTTIFGPYSVFVGSLDAGACAFFYFRTYWKKVLPIKVATMPGSKIGSLH